MHRLAEVVHVFGAVHPERVDVGLLAIGLRNNIVYQYRLSLVDKG